MYLCWRFSSGRELNLQQLKTNESAPRLQSWSAFQGWRSHEMHGRRSGHQRPLEWPAKPVPRACQRQRQAERIKGTILTCRLVKKAESHTPGTLRAALLVCQTLRSLDNNMRLNTSEVQPGMTQFLIESEPIEPRAVLLKSALSL